MKTVAKLMLVVAFVVVVSQNIWAAAAPNFGTAPVMEYALVVERVAARLREQREIGIRPNECIPIEKPESVSFEETGFVGYVWIKETALHRTVGPGMNYEIKTLEPGFYRIGTDYRGFSERRVWFRRYYYTNGHSTFGYIAEESILSWCKPGPPSQ